MNSGHVHVPRLGLVPAADGVLAVCEPCRVAHAWVMKRSNPYEPGTTRCDCCGRPDPSWVDVPMEEV